jgi:hypothetical protein
VYASTGATGNELKLGEETGGDFLPAEKTDSIPLAAALLAAVESLVAGDEGADD